MSVALGAATSAARTIVFAGGGTGGHLSPGIAIAEQLASQRPDVRRVFACSNRSIDALMLTEAGERFIPTEAALLGVSPGAIARFVRGWRATARRLRAFHRDEGADVVVALGGFVAAPVAMSLRKRGVPVILLNLDVVPGKANRLIARRSDLVVSVCDTPAFPGFAARRIPMPLRRSTLASTFGDQRECKTALGLDPNLPVLLITGASQGAKSINDLMSAILRGRPALLRGWQVYHITGHGREGDFASQYAAAGVRARVEPFQSRMGLAWGAADFAISRAGANSVAEIAANSVPALFLPYPHHRDQHQRENARPLVEIGGAFCEEDHDDAIRNLDSIPGLLETALNDPDCRSEMVKALNAHRPPNGAAELARIVVGTLDQPPK